VKARRRDGGDGALRRPGSHGKHERTCQKYDRLEDRMEINHIRMLKSAQRTKSEAS
jgi:hypothetical protein